MNSEHLKLSNQVCFPVYAASRLITREYQPYLDKLGITYPQYLVLLVLWETDGISVNDIAHKLILNTNTVTPLLKRMEAQGLIRRNRAQTDERKVIIELTAEGKKMKQQAVTIPHDLVKNLQADGVTVDELVGLREQLNTLIQQLSRK